MLTGLHSNPLIHVDAAVAASVILVPGLLTPAALVAHVVALQVVHVVGEPQGLTQWEQRHHHMAVAVGIGDAGHRHLCRLRLVTTAGTPVKNDSHHTTPFREVTKNISITLFSNH